MIKSMTKRDIFSEVVEGFDALKLEREGKLTLHQVKVQAKPVPVLASTRRHRPTGFIARGKRPGRFI